MTRSGDESEVLFEIDGSPMRALDTGRGEVVVLSHGYLWDAEMWRPQIDYLSKHYRVVVPELWGHGGSGPLPTKARTLADLARHHLTLLDRLGIERFALVGHSVGGMAGVELALLAPERLTALVLMDAYVGPEIPAAAERYFAMLDAVEARGAVPEDVINATMSLHFSTTPVAPAIEAKLRDRMLDSDRDRLIDTIVPLGRMIFGRRDAISDLARITSPTLMLWGREDIARPIREGRAMAALLNCRIVEFPGAGHLPMLEAPAAVNRELLAFLMEAGAPAD